MGEDSTISNKGLYREPTFVELAVVVLKGKASKGEYFFLGFLVAAWLFAIITMLQRGCLTGGGRTGYEP
jgi:hypothetical protein